MSPGNASISAPAVAAPARLLPPWRDMDDAALCAHFCGPRPVRLTPCVDAAEVTPARLDGILAGHFEFNGETYALGDPGDAGHWLINPSMDVEWHILLHKFYYAVGLAQRWREGQDRRARDRLLALLDGWMHHVPVDFIAADVTGRRVQNWVACLHLLFSGGGRTPQHAALPAPLLRRLLDSLHDQVEFLCRALTPKRNHRTLELMAIFMAGVAFPEFARAGHWRDFALAQTLANLEADLLIDGVHCELSTDYHHLALRNWLLVRRLACDNGVVVPPALDRGLERALEFALHVHQPDGIVPSLSDGDARSYLALLAEGAALYGRADMRFVATLGREGHPPAATRVSFAASGYHVVRSAWQPAQGYAAAQHLIWDCGPLGEGNHGHFDALSFTLYAHGRALIVDPGRYTYSEAGEHNWRVHFRSTAAHNTVCVDARPQTRYLPRPVPAAGSRHAGGGVRHTISGPTPATTLLERCGGSDWALLHGRCVSHAYDAVHERCLLWLGDWGGWIVSDWLRADDEHHYALRFQLGAEASGCSELCEQHGHRLVRSPGLQMLQPLRLGQTATLAAAWVSQAYGHKDPAPALVTEARGRDVDFDTLLKPHDGPHDGGAPAPSFVEAFNVPGDDGSLGVGLRFGACDGSVRGWFHARGAPSPSWRLGQTQLIGRWLQWREDAHGRLVAARTHPQARVLDRRGEPLRGVDIGDGT